MNFIFSRIQNKLIAAFILVLVIPLLIVGFYSYQTTRNVLLKNEIGRNWSLGSTQAKNISSLLERIMSDVLYWSRDESLLNLLEVKQEKQTEKVKKATEEIIQALIETAKKEGIYNQIRYIDENGDEIFRIQNKNHNLLSVPQSDLEKNIQADWYAEVMQLGESQIYVSPLQLDKIGGKIETPHRPVIQYATPLFHLDLQRAGVFLVSVEANYFLSGIARATGETSSNYLIDHEGYFLVHPDKEKCWGRDLNTQTTVNSEFPAVAAAITGTDAEGAFIQKDDLVTFSRFNPPGQTRMRWSLVSMTPLAEVIAPVYNFTTIFMVLSLVGLLGAIILAIFLARGISAPLLHLSDVADQISRGDLAAEINVKSPDEIGKLAESLKRMSASLESAIVRLRKRKG
ncbi:cache and HAMP domain-containing protein [candidate division KSB1 bacterium]|nr:cache and HAMP domain-containing protein [candidate division KSB1 bacterium]